MSKLGKTRYAAASNAPTVRISTAPRKAAARRMKINPFTMLWYISDR